MFCDFDIYILPVSYNISTTFCEVSFPAQTGKLYGEMSKLLYIERNFSDSLTNHCIIYTLFYKSGKVYWLPKVLY